MIKHSDGLTVTSPTIMWVKVQQILLSWPHPQLQAHSQLFNSHFFNGPTAPGNGPGDGALYIWIYAHVYNMNFLNAPIANLCICLSTYLSCRRWTCCFRRCKRLVFPLAVWWPCPVVGSNMAASTGGRGVRTC